MVLSVALGTGVSASPGAQQEMQSLRLHPCPPDQDSGRVGGHALCMIPMKLQLEEHWFEFPL